MNTSFKIKAALINGSITLGLKGSILKMLGLLLWTWDDSFIIVIGINRLTPLPGWR
jgi:hypothetical protein